MNRTVEALDVLFALVVWVWVGLVVLVALLLLAKIIEAIADALKVSDDAD